MTIYDLSSYFLQAYEGRESWINEGFSRVLDRVKSQFGLSINWDRTVPEHWAGIDRRGEGIASIHIKLPLLVVLAKEAKHVSVLLEQWDMVCVTVDDWLEESYRMSQDVYDQCFPHRESDMFDVAEFSIGQLVFATI